MAIVYAGGSLDSIASLRTRWVGVTREKRDLTFRVFSAGMTAGK